MVKNLLLSGWDKWSQNLFKDSLSNFARPCLKREGGAWFNDKNI